MLKLQEAPPRRAVNWYRVAARVILALLIVGIVICAVIAFPYFFSSSEPNTFKAVAADGHGVLYQAVVFIGSFPLLLLSCAVIVFAAWLPWKILMTVCYFIDWWSNKIKEADAKAKEHSGYHD